MNRPRVTWEQWTARERGVLVIRHQWVIRWTDSEGVARTKASDHLPNAMNFARRQVIRAARGAS